MCSQNIKPFLHCIIFSHTWLLWTFAPWNEWIQIKLVPPPDSTTRDHHHSQFLYVSHKFCLSFEQISTLISVLHLFSRIITAVFNNVYYTVLVFWLHQAFKFFFYGVLAIKTVIGFNPQLEFCNSETSHLCFLSKKTKGTWFLFCCLKPIVAFELEIAL